MDVPTAATTNGTAAHANGTPAPTVKGNSTPVPTVTGNSTPPIAVKGNGTPAVAVKGPCTEVLAYIPGVVPGIPEVTPASPVANQADMALLAKLDAANRLLECDEKSLRSLSNTPSKQSSQSGHSRKGSESSVLSSNSVSSNISNLQYEEESNNPDDAWVIWGKIVNDWDNVVKKKAIYVKELVRKGVPHHFRGIVWQLLCNAHISDAKDAYAEYLKMTSPYEKVIRRDITRTYPEHDFFKEKNGLGQESLFNVMKAYSLHDREVGYCQGSGFIVGLLLMQMPEEEAFAVLVKLMQEYRLRELFKPSMAELGLCMFQLECMIQEQLPELYMHFQSQNFCVSMFASSWFLTLFTTSLPLTVACRIFDVFLSEGMETVFRVGYSILQMSHDELLSQDMEGMLKFLQKEMPVRHEQDPDALLGTAFSVKYNNKKMKKLEKEYNALKTKEQEDQVELRRLRTENRLLRQRIDNLEKETATLADRLIQDQVICAQKEEEIFILRRELATLRQHDATTSEQLQRLQQEFNDHKERESVVTSSATQESRRIEELQKELTELKQKEQEANGTMRQLNDRVRELESANRELHKEPSTEIQQLQEELIAAKLREAEANLSMKELRQRVTDLDRHWQKHMEKSNAVEEGQQKPSKKREQQLADDLMTVRLREAEALADLKEMKQKVMELETQNQICNRQIKRMDDERSKLQDKLEEAGDRDKEHNNKLKELERKESDQDSKRKEDIMMSRIKDAEHSQMIAEMRQRIAELEIENQELITAGQLQEKGETQELENRIADLQEEVMQLKMAKRLQSISSLALNHITLDTESDYDTDDMEATLMDSHKLKLSDGLTTIVGDAHRFKLNDLDSSEGEGLYDFDDGTIKRRTSKKKKRSGSKSSVSGEGKDSTIVSRQPVDNKDGGSSGVSSAGSTGVSSSASTEATGSSSPSSGGSHVAVDAEVLPVAVSNGDLPLPTSDSPTTPSTPTTPTAKTPQTLSDINSVPATTTVTSLNNGAVPATITTTTTTPTAVVPETPAVPTD